MILFFILSIICEYMKIKLFQPDSAYLSYSMGFVVFSTTLRPLVFRRKASQDGDVSSVFISDTDDKILDVDAQSGKCVLKEANANSSSRFGVNLLENGGIKLMSGNMCLGKGIQGSLERQECTKSPSQLFTFVIQKIEDIHHYHDHHHHDHHHGNHHGSHHSGYHSHHDDSSSSLGCIDIHCHHYFFD